MQYELNIWLRILFYVNKRNGPFTNQNQALSTSSDLMADL